MTTRITEAASPNYDVQYGTAELSGPDTFTCHLRVIPRGDAAALPDVIGTGATDEEAQQDARRKAHEAISAVDGPAIMAAAPEDEQARTMRLYRQKRFGITSEPVRDGYGGFLGERVYRITHNGRQESAVLSLAPHEARQLFDQLSTDFGFIQLSKPLAMLEGRPVFELNTLYSSSGERMVAMACETGFQLNMLRDDDSGDGTHLWATDTHAADGKQLLFWVNPTEASE